MTNPDHEKHFESIARKELISKALIAWAEIFPRQQPVDDKRINELEKGLYVVGDRYPVERTPKQDYLSGVRLGYSQNHQGMWLYANDYTGDPAPLLVKLAEDLNARGVEVVFVNRQFSYDPPDPEATGKVIEKFNLEHKKSKDAK